jgi:hypothetical protein
MALLVAKINDARDYYSPEFMLVFPTKFTRISPPKLWPVQAYDST